MSSGGVLYHLRALRFGRDSKSALWESHRQDVERFLLAWAPPEKTLVLIGPSGGYSLPESFLKRFDQVIAFEPDPLARFIFSKRIHGHITWMPKAVPFEDFPQFAKDLPKDSAILFCNLLGQLPLKNIKRIRNGLLQALSHHSWASYHDALSGKKVQFDVELIPRGRRATLAEMRSAVYPMIRNGTVVIHAHQAPELFQSVRGYAHFYWQWRILPNRTHLIEGVFHRNSDPSGA